MGEWNQIGIPHKGWHCMDVIDLAEGIEPGEKVEYEQCEMCGNEKVRFVHIMKHPEYPKELKVGCVCAEKMSDDYINPRKRENELKNKCSRRNSFNKVKWKKNFDKNTYSKKHKGEYITIMQSRYGNWGIFFADNRIWEYEGKKILSFEEAEKIAFKVFEKYHTTKEERRRTYY